MVTAAMKLEDTCFLAGKLCKTRQYFKKQIHHFADKGPYNKGYGLSSTHVWMWELDHKEGRLPENWCFQTMVLEKTLESLLETKEIKPVNPKWHQHWIFIERTDVEATILGPPDANKPTHWKRPWCWERLKAGGEGNDRGWDGWMASPIQWTWTWANSRRC